MPTLEDIFTLLQRIMSLIDLNIVMGIGICVMVVAILHSTPVLRKLKERNARARQRQDQQIVLENSHKLAHR